jgi:hypothetical protein
MRRGKKGGPRAPSLSPPKGKSSDRSPDSSGRIPGAALSGLLGMMGQGGPGPTQSGPEGPNPMGAAETAPGEGPPSGPPPGMGAGPRPRRRGAP